MSSSPKRHIRDASPSISPPATKRRKLNITPAATTTTDDVSSTRNSNHLRIFSWNVNGIGPLLQKQLNFDKPGTTPLRAFLKRHHWPDVVCLQEVKINSKDEKTQRLLERSANDHRLANEPTYTAIFSLPRDKHNATGFGGKLYGVVSLIRGDTSTVISSRKPEWDLEGRVLIHELSCGIVVINGYWVNGTSNPYRDSVTGKSNGTRHDHKLRFHQHMLDECITWEKRGLGVILIGDMNIARGFLDGHPNLRTRPAQHIINRQDFNTKFIDGRSGFHGVDVFRHLHGSQRKYTYYPRNCAWGASCDRVDMIVISARMLETPGLTVGSDICDTPADRGHSDHVPLWVSLVLPDKPISSNVTPEKSAEQVSHQPNMIPP